MFKIKIISFILISIFTYSQNSLSESIGKKVIINKKLVSYSLGKEDIIDGKGRNRQTKLLNIDNPYYIYITSDNEKSSIRVNSRNLSEDYIVDFGKIYRIDDTDFIIYDFIKSNTCTATLFKPNDGFNQSIYIDCVDRTRNGIRLIFTLPRSGGL